MESTDPLMSLTELDNEAINAVRAYMLIKEGAPAPEVLVTGGVVAVASSYSRRMSSSNTSPALVVILLLVVSNWENN